MASDAQMKVVVVYFWKLRPKSLPFALFHMALDRTLMRRFKGVHFAKALGCGKGETFTPSDADITRWGSLFVIDENQVELLDASPLISRWRAESIGEYRAILDPISSHGLWSKRNPFDFRKDGFRKDVQPSPGSGVVAITRARIAWKKNFLFWRAVPPVTASLRQSEGLIHAIGIGEAPIGLQGTYSQWASGGALRDFAYKGQAHQDAIAATTLHRWYSEELFARFSIRQIRGSI